MTDQQQKDLNMLIAIALQPADPMNVYEKGVIAGMNLARDRDLLISESAWLAQLLKKHSGEAQ